MKITIIDTGCANFASLYYAITRLGYQATISNEINVIQQADRVILPGVGTANAAMVTLQRYGLIETIQACQQPLLGICLGMQLFAQSSEEGASQTLGIIDEPVRQLQHRTLPLPHMGWNQVEFLTQHPLFHQITTNSYYYFVHSYAWPVTTHTLAITNYGNPFSAVIQRDNFIGVQFHPERSGKLGAQLLANFIQGHCND